MKRKTPIGIIILIILSILVTNTLGPISNAVKLPDSFSSLAPYLLVGLTLVLIFIALLYQRFLQREKAEPTPPRIQSPRNRQRLLARVRGFWIDDVLKRSLYGAALIALGLSERKDLLTNPWHLVLQESEQPPRYLKSGTRITQVYDDSLGELLILGEPGSGKTTLLLELARELLTRAEKDDRLPMPVIFNLSAWAVKRQPLAQWLVEEMNEKYQVPLELAQSWVNSDQLVLLLDGLDEVAANARASCVESINTFRHEHGLVSLVVCSRQAEYLEQKRRILLSNTVVLQPLTEHQIDDYISSAAGRLDVLRHMLRDNPPLKELATNPLMLSVLALTYSDRPVGGLAPHNISPLLLRHEVFHAYVQRMLERRGANVNYSPQQAIRWLSWLADQLEERGQQFFQIRWLVPDWLPNDRLRRLYGGLLSSFTIGSAVGLVTLLSIGLWAGLIGSVFAGTISGLLVILIYRREMAMASRKIPLRSRRNIARGLLGRQGIVAVNSMIASIIVEYSIALIHVPFGWGIGCLVGGFFGGLFFVFFYYPPDHDQWLPSASMRRDCTLAIIFSSVYILLAITSYLLVGHSLFFPIIATYFILAGGGVDLLEYFIIFLLLWYGGYAPLNYPHFLDYATERIFLRKVLGYIYIFVHPLLREYFATLNSVPEKKE